jgi:transposase
LVTAADVQDRDGGVLLLSTLFGQFPFLRKLFADSAYAGPVFANGIADVMPNLATEIVRRRDNAKGFVVEPQRWIVERTIGWLNRCRRLAKDWENRNCNALAFLHLASIRLMVAGAKPVAVVAFSIPPTRLVLIHSGDGGTARPRCVVAAGAEGSGNSLAG